MDKIIGGLFVIAVIGIIGGVVWGVVSDMNNHSRLMAQCMADGKKEYECVLLLKSNSSTVAPMPIIIPMGR